MSEVNTFNPTKATPPMADISQVKRLFLDIPYGASKAQAIDIYLPDEGEGPSRWWCTSTAAASRLATSGTST